MPSTIKEPSNSEILEAIKENGKDIRTNSREISGIKGEISVMKGEISSTKGQIILMKLEYDKRFQLLEERTALIPKLYDLVDGFVKELEEGRQERAMMFGRAERHEKRTSKLESKVFA